MRILITTLTAFLLFTACKKDKNKNDDTPPPQTQNGANILSCKVNGVWHNYSGVPTQFHDVGVNYDIYGSANGFYIQLLANSDKYNDGIITRVYQQHPIAGEIYKLASESQNMAEYMKSNATYEAFLNSGQIIFTRCDSAVAAGTFYFTAVRNSDTVKVTEGFFDIARSE